MYEQNKVGMEEPRIGCLWAECGICLKPSSRHINSLYTLCIGEKTKSNHNLFKLHHSIVKIFICLSKYLINKHDPNVESS